MLPAMDLDDRIYLPPGASPGKERAYSEDGVDLTLIRAMLDLTPSQRLRQLQDFINSVERIRKRNGKWNESRTSKPS